MSSPDQGATAAPVKIPAPITAVIGLIVAAVSLMVFVFDLLVTPEIDALIVSFVVCGLGLTMGFFVLRRLAPRREPMSLSLDSGCVSIRPVARADIAVRTVDSSRHGAKAAISVPGVREADLTKSDDRPQSISQYKAPAGGGFIGLIAMIGMAIMLVIGSNFARQFLSLAIPAGGVVALVLYCARHGNLD